MYRMGKKTVVAWATLLVLSTFVQPVFGQGGTTGLTASVCVNLGVLLALTITPVETLVDVFRNFLPDPDE